MAPAPLTLQLHPSTQLLAGGRALRAGSRRALAMAVLLALEGEVTRDRLADLLWPGTARPDARRNLRRDLFRLRELALPIEDRGREVVALNAPVIAWPAPDGPTPRWMQDLEGVAGAELDDWLDAQRPRLQVRWIDALAARARTLEAGGDEAGALRLWTEMLDDAVAGPDYTEARHAATQLRARLGRHADAPAPPRLRPAAVPPETRPESPTVRATPGLPARLPFVAREDLVARLHEAFARRQLVFVDGMPGAGKTRLALEATATLGGTLHVRCRPEDAADAFASATRLLHELIETAPDVALPAWVRRTLSRLLPASADDLARAALSHPLPSPPASAEPTMADLRRGFEAAWRALARDNFSAVVLDDWQWADPSSLALWDLDAPPDPDWPVARVVVHRSAELSVAMLEHRRALIDSGRAVAVSVPNLSAGELATLVRTLAGAQGGQRFAARLHQATAGNPLFVLETLRHLFAGGLLDADAQGRWHTPFDNITEDYAELPVPPGVREAVQARCRALGPATRRLLEAACLAGDGLTPRLLAEPAGLDELQAAEALEHAVASAFLIAWPPGAASAGSYRFTHDLLAQSLAEGLSPARRLALHGRLAERMAAIDGPPGLIADQFARAGRERESAEWHQRAGDAAARRLARSEALRHYELALGGLVDPESRCAVQHARAEALFRLGDQAGGLQALESALPDAARAGRTHTLEVMLAQARMRVGPSRGPQSEAVLAELEALAGDPSLTGRQAAEVDVERSRVLTDLGRYDEALAVQLARLAQLPASELAVRHQIQVQRAHTQLRQGRLAQAHADAQAALQLARQLGDPDLEIAALSNVVSFERMIGRAVEFEQSARELLVQARRSGWVHLHQVALYHLVVACTDGGRADEAEVYVDEALDRSAFWTDVHLRQVFLEARLYIHQLRGEREAALAAAGPLLDNARTLRDPHMVLGAMRLVFDLHLALGEHEPAQALLTEAEAVVDHSVDASLRRRELAVCRLQLAQARGQGAEALALVQAQRPTFEQLDSEMQVRWLGTALQTVLDQGDEAAIRELDALAAADRGAAIETRSQLLAARLRAARRLRMGIDEAHREVNTMLADPDLPVWERQRLQRALAGSPAAD